jgi:hypothetical protein
MDPAAQTWAREALGQEIERLLASEGPHAFELPRSAAIAHETGHAIVGTHEGIAISAVRVWSVPVSPQEYRLMGPTWTGETVDPAWGITPITPTAVILSRVRMILAGVIGEAVLDPENCRKGSSLDERLLGRMLCETLLRQHADDFPDIDRPQDIYCMLVMQVSAILKRNEGMAQCLMRKLAHQGTVRGQPLAKILQQVRRVEFGSRAGFAA